eukprot:scaffold1958_cov198-Alexandrium_tamarense.AAC.11
MLSTGVCKGISVETIEKHGHADVEKTKRGFYHLVGNAIRYKANSVSTKNGQWSRLLNNSGCIMKHPTKESEIAWVCCEAEDGSGDEQRCCTIVTICDYLGY